VLTDAAEVTHISHPQRWNSRVTWFPGGAGGQAGGMDDDQRDNRAADTSPRTSADDTQDAGSTAATVARMLANPRRVRRS
jgi:hypothetical protein